MKDITFTVPCYNSEEYMEHCIDTLLSADERAEIIIVDDGSTDRTGEIADNYARNYPEIVRVIHQENGGHGAGVNAGLALASGKYFKVVDSDDWLDERELQKLLKKIREWEKREITVDLIICNYLYDHSYENKVKRMGYKNVLKENQVCGQAFPSVPVSCDALLVLPHGSAEKVWGQASEAYVLCGQYLCEPAAAVCADALLPEPGLVPLFPGQGRSVCK